MNLVFKKNFKNAKLLTKTSFLPCFRDHPKNGKGKKQRRRRKYMNKGD